ncbi:MAG: hypothetical protein R2845_08815 [Thermomicrobiales bacterium]
MAAIDVIIATKLPLYREVLAATFHALRPDLSVLSVSEHELESAVMSHRPWMVICSVVSQAISDACASWILLFPDERDEALVSIAGVRQTIPHADVHQLLDIIQEARPGTAIHPNG